MKEGGKETYPEELDGGTQIANTSAWPALVKGAKAPVVNPNTC